MCLIRDKYASTPRSHLVLLLHLATALYTTLGGSLPASLSFLLASFLLIPVALSALHTCAITTDFPLCTTPCRVRCRRSQRIAHAARRRRYVSTSAPLLLTLLVRERRERWREIVGERDSTKRTTSLSLCYSLTQD